MSIDRQEFTEELALRECIRKVIRIVKEKKNNQKLQQLNEEKELRSVIRELILAEAKEMDPIEGSPRSGSTVTNFLEELFQNTITQVLDDYDKLGEVDERRGFFAGFLSGVENAFAEFDAIGDAEAAAKAANLQEADIDINVDDEEAEEGPVEPDLFVPAGTETDLEPEEAEEEPEPEESVLEPPVEKSPEYKLGYNAAQRTIPKVIKRILEGYEEFMKVGDYERANTYKNWARINYGLHMINKEKLITGKFPEIPEEFAAEIEKFKADEPTGFPTAEAPPEEEFDLDF